MLHRTLAWQSKLILLLVIPFVAAGLVLQAHGWANFLPSAVIWTLGISLVLALIVLKLRSATLTGACTGAVLTASLMFSTLTYPYVPWHTSLPAVLAVSLLASLSTRMGRERKAQLGTAEGKQGRNAAQIAANLGFAALLAEELVRIWISDGLRIAPSLAHPQLAFTPMLAALAEAAADTVSSEIGQILGGRPRMITSFRQVEAGTDGAITLAGTLAGSAAGCIVAAIGTVSLGGDASLFWLASAGAAFGLLFDSLLGALLERRGWLNNDAVNFLSTISAAAFALALTALPHLRAR